MTTPQTEQTDALTTPLGKAASPAPGRAAAVLRFAPHALMAVLATALLGFAGLAMVGHDPLGGEPSTVVSTRPPAPEKTAANQGPATNTGKPGQAAEGDVTPKTGEPKQQIVTIIDGISGKRQQVAITATPDPNKGSGSTKSADPAPASADPRFTETSRHGPIPKVGADGTRPLDVYAGKPGPRQGHRIVIIVGRLGLSEVLTNEALAKLPPQVTLAFSPYGRDLERWAMRARGDGREVLLHLPMEPFDYPENDPGPHTLLTSLAAEQNIDRLHWAMSRFTGYAGLINHMGGRFVSNEVAVTPVLREAARRGLAYVDDGSVARSLSGQIASAQNLPFAKADLLIDAKTNAADIDQALARLEAISRERGVAVGFAGALPLTITRIAAWAKAAEKRGFVIVPASAAISKPKSS